MRRAIRRRAEIVDPLRKSPSPLSFIAFILDTISVGNALGYLAASALNTTEAEHK